MGIAIFSPQFSSMAALSVLVSPLQAFLALFVPSEPAPQTIRSSAVRSAASGGTSRLGQPTTSIAGRREAQGPLSANAETCIPAKPTRLKIVRQFEPGVGPSLAGRMVISGRMADVCAALDKMEQKESASVQIPMF